MSDRLKLAMVNYQKLNAGSVKALIEVAALLAHALTEALEKLEHIEREKENDEQWPQILKWHRGDWTGFGYNACGCRYEVVGRSSTKVGYWRVSYIDELGSKAGGIDESTISLKARLLDVVIKHENE